MCFAVLYIMMFFDGRKEGKLQEEVCFLSEAPEVQEVEACAIEAGCGRDVAGLLRTSLCKV